MAPPIAVIGAGAWGTALAIAARRAGAPVLLWARRPVRPAALAATRTNAAYLPEVPLDPAIAVAADPAALADAGILLLAVPAQHLRATLLVLAPALPPAAPLVLCAKGIERGTLLLPGEVVDAVLPGRRWAVLSGPTFAAEVARGLPTAITLAAADPDLAAGLAAAIGSATFRPYAAADPTGAMLGGALKNVLAIACGIVMGRRLGDNARAALTARGLAELMRLGRAKGADPATLMGLAGLGDLVLTCTSRQSRNLSLGIALGEGAGLAQALAGARGVVEGAATAGAAVALAARLGVELPIARAVDAVLNAGAEIDATVAALLARPFKAET
ncbi:MAG: NAD(P)H-dependent glycerol-3-phosphate dehydrogenase [Dongiaceae bacterium]